MKHILVTLFLGITFGSFSQYDMDKAKSDSTKKNEVSLYQFTDRLYVGGELGLSLNQNSAYVLLAPLVGYDITERFSAGISTMYQVYRFNSSGGAVNYSSIGAGVFSRFRPINPILMQVEFDLFNTNDFHTGTLERVNVPAFMAGLGYAGSFGVDSYYQILLMYDFIDNPNMPLPPVVFSPLHLKMGMIWHL